MPNVQLEATSVGGRVQIGVVSGNPAPQLDHGSGAHRFDFDLVDNTQPKLNVRFKPIGSMLDREDDNPACPPAQGNNSEQIVGVTRQSDTRAGFTDNNNNPKRDMPVSYQLNFECDNPGMHPISFDPIIINGGQ